MLSTVFAQANFKMLENVAAPNFAGAKVADFFSGDGGLLTYVLFFATSALLIYIILGGYELMTSGGDPKKVQSGRSKVTYAILGFVIIFLAYWIVQFIGLIFGLEDVSNIFA